MKLFEKLTAMQMLTPQRFIRNTSGYLEYQPLRLPFPLTTVFRSESFVTKFWGVTELVASDCVNREEKNNFNSYFKIITRLNNLLRRVCYFAQIHFKNNSSQIHTHCKRGIYLTFSYLSNKISYHLQLYVDASSS